MLIALALSTLLTTYQSVDTEHGVVKVSGQKVYYTPDWDKTYEVLMVKLPFKVVTAIASYSDGWIILKDVKTESGLIIPLVRIDWVSGDVQVFKDDQWYSVEA